MLSQFPTFILLAQAKLIALNPLAENFDIFTQFYLLAQYVVGATLTILILALALRLILNLIDPNPFGAFGRFASWFKRRTDGLVSPTASWLARGGVNPKYAPLLTMFAACLAGYFVLQAVFAVCFTLDGVVNSAANGRVISLVGYVLYGFLALLSLAIVVRIVLLWIGVYGNWFSNFLARVTDPILIPARSVIPPFGVLDLSVLIVLLIIGFLESAVARTLIGL